MRHLLAAIAAAVVFLCQPVQAQTVNDTLTIRYTLPTTTVSGLPLTGANALTEIRVFIDTAPIPDTATTPTVTVTPTQTTVLRTVAVQNGQTIYVRIRTCNRPGTVVDCSALTNPVTKPVQLSTTPSMPTNVTVELEIGG